MSVWLKLCEKLRRKLEKAPAVRLNVLRQELKKPHGKLASGLKEL